MYKKDNPCRHLGERAGRYMLLMQCIPISRQPEIEEFAHADAGRDQELLRLFFGGAYREEVGQ